MWAALGKFIAFHWKWFAGGAVIIAIVIGFQLVQHQRDKAREEAELAKAQRAEAVARLRVSNASTDRLQKELDAQNDAIDALATDGQERIREGQQAIMAEVRKGAKAQAVAGELDRTPTQSKEQAKTSDKVMANKDLL